ncbi:MAG TPA: Ig-like domain-containing protein [Beijerinckiaceae bacterium]|nr:Ig-like domain-containing protein [Beijerinckiaceae bacterium]
MRVVVLAAAFCLSAVAAQAQTCRVPTIRTFDNQTVDGQMTVKAGTRCNIFLQNSMGPVETTRIVSRPAAGSATVSGTRVTYVPRAGYTGPDRFTYARAGQDRYGRASVKTVNVHVQVIP